MRLLPCSGKICINSTSKHNGGNFSKKLIPLFARPISSCNGAPLTLSTLSLYFSSGKANATASCILLICVHALISKTEIMSKTWHLLSFTFDPPCCLWSCHSFAPFDKSMETEMQSTYLLQIIKKKLSVIQTYGVFKKRV